ncbi:MAG: hypothetical protein HY454_00195, partial [Parcubacteria group bacterium]|nr:hypothetical protein [Parcubacteria group bacterium]
MKEENLHFKNHILLAVGLLAAGFFLYSFFASAQTTSSSLSNGAAADQIDGAIKELSAIYGQPIAGTAEAKAICNLEKYFADCAEIGKKYNLYAADELKKIEPLLQELKGDIINDLKKCADESCLIKVAQKLSGQLSAKNSKVASDFDLTPSKVREKKAIVDTAKELGVSFEDCRTMDPDMAPAELLRACAKLAKSERVKQYIPEAAKDAAALNDSAANLKESLEKGVYQCGDNTLDGCGSYCLNPGAQARAAGATAIPAVCRTIAEDFFGPEGVKQLEAAYSEVHKTFEFYNKRAENIVFTASLGQTLTDPAAIGQYLEEEGRKGNVPAVEKGLDFMVSKGLITQKDSSFALNMVKKVKESGKPIDFVECGKNPGACAEFVPDEHREDFAAAEAVFKIMNDEVKKRGVPSDSECASGNPFYSKGCLEGGEAAIARLEDLALKNPQIKNLITDIKRRIEFGKSGTEARTRVEQEFQKSGGLNIGGQRFENFGQVDAFCSKNGEACLSEAAKQGWIDKGSAEKRYEYTLETKLVSSPGSAPFPAYGPASSQRFQGFGGPGSGFTSGFDKEEALKQFKAWLDNPQGPPPAPPGYYGYGQQYPYNRPAGTGTQVFQPQIYPDPLYCAPRAPTRSCPSGEYHREFRAENGCIGLEEACVPIPGFVYPNRQTCPALPNVSSCPQGEERFVSFTSPECGTYYACRRPQTPGTIAFPYTFISGKVVNSFEDGKAYCIASGIENRDGVRPECEAKFGVVYQ